MYLEEEGFEHTSLDWDTILLNQAGEVKIGKNAGAWLEDIILTNLGKQECCQRATNDCSSRHVSRVGHITRGLMNKDDKPVGVQRPQWLLCSEAINFVAATTSAKSAEELLKVFLPSRLSTYVWANAH